MKSGTPSTPSPTVEVIVLNGASSSGKTTLALALQDILDESWLVFGIDTLIGALPLALIDIHDDATIGARPPAHDVRDGGLTFEANGEISVGAEYRRLEAAWLEGLATIAATGTRLILDEVFLGGKRSQDRLRGSFPGRHIAWIGVTCEHNVAIERERIRGDRVVGEFEKQSTLVHEGVVYDLVVDSTVHTPHELARQITEHLHDASS
jgi:chloramphenicol 3-O phosphotransferase